MQWTQQRVNVHVLLCNMSMKLGPMDMSQPTHDSSPCHDDRLANCVMLYLW